MPAIDRRDPVVARLRRRLAQIDRSLVRVLATRERVQATLLAYKAMRAFPLEDPVQEEKVRLRAREWARRTGADADIAESVVMACVASGKSRFVSGRKALGLPGPEEHPVAPGPMSPPTPLPPIAAGGPDLRPSGAGGRHSTGRS
ncbi:MAG: chorismate mutase [Thermoplasmata archaeon]